MLERKAIGAVAFGSSVGLAIASTNITETALSGNPKLRDWKTRIELFTKSRLDRIVLRALIVERTQIETIFGAAR